MIELKETARDGMLEIRMSGAITDEDYREVLVPAIDKAIEDSERVRVLVELESDISDFTLGAMMDDARMGLKHWRGFDRCAVVTGSDAMRRVVKAFWVFMPCPVKVFAPEEIDEARRWLSESLGSIHQTDLGNGVLHIQLLGQLDAAVYAEESADLDAFIRKNDRFRMLLDIREFDGWQGLGAIGEHLKLVRNHAGLVDRAAIVGDAGWQRMAAEVGKRVLSGEVRYFPGAEIEAAKSWLAA